MMFYMGANPAYGKKNVKKIKTKIGDNKEKHSKGTNFDSFPDEDASSEIDHIQ